MRLISLVKFDKCWASNFRDEIISIEKYLNEILVSSYHIGSTAIIGIRAKPVIDILLEVSSINKIDKFNKNFELLGYEIKGEYGIKGRRFLQKKKIEITHHIHIYETGNSEIERHKIFVDFMNAHPGKATEYEKLKISLLNKYKYEPNKYLAGKSDFIKNIDSEAIKWKSHLTKCSI